MAAYHIWHPAYVRGEPLTLEAFVTLGDAIFLSRGTDAFVQAALSVLGVTIRPADWQFEAMRTHYFSSYRDSSSDWEDRWSLAWRLRVVLSPPQSGALADLPAWGYFDLDAADGSFRADDRPQQWAGWPCLILADASSMAIYESAERVVHNLRPQATCEHGKAFGRYDQLRCDLGYFPRDFYQQGAPEAEALLHEISKTGASVRFNGSDR
jgi:hypothetical protein